MSPRYYVIKEYNNDLLSAVLIILCVVYCAFQYIDHTQYSDLMHIGSHFLILCTTYTRCTILVVKFSHVVEIFMHLELNISIYLF